MFGRDDDLEAWGRVLQGDGRALESLRRKYYSELCRFIKRSANEVDEEEAEDRAWLIVWESRETFQHKSKFKSWLFGIARNVALDMTRRDRAHQHKIDELIRVIVLGEAANGEDYIVMIMALRHCLKKLEMKFLEVIHLRYMLQLSDVAIAERLGRPLGTVKGQVQSGLRQLRVCMQAGEVTE